MDEMWKWAEEAVNGVPTSAYGPGYLKVHIFEKQFLLWSEINS